MNNIENNRLQEVDPITLKHWLDQNLALLVDVREPSEFAGERIQGAINRPLSSLDFTKIPPYSPGQQLVLQCQTGNRSQQAAQKIWRSGGTNVAHLKGGLTAWKEAGYPVQKSRNAPISLMRQVQIVAGSLIVTGTVLGVLISPAWLFLSGFVGAGLIFSGLTGTCGMAMLLAKLPYNQKG